MYRKDPFIIISLQKRKNTKAIPSEEHYAIPVSLAQDKLKDIKCQLKYLPIYFCVFFVAFFPRFLWLICRVFYLVFSCAYASFFHLPLLRSCCV
jgi:hypothetical protein